MTDEQLRNDPIVAKALALGYVSLNDLKHPGNLALARVLQKHAEYAMAGLPLKGPEVQEAMDKVNGI